MSVLQRKPKLTVLIIAPDENIASGRALRRPYAKGVIDAHCYVDHRHWDVDQVRENCVVFRPVPENAFAADSERPHCALARERQRVILTGLDLAHVPV